VDGERHTSADDSGNMTSRPGAALAVGASRFWGQTAPGFFGELFGGVQWSPSFIALLYYTFAILTYQVSGARYAMIAAVAGLLVEPQNIRFNSSLGWLFAMMAWAWVAAFGSGGSPVAIEGAQDLGKLAIIAFVIYNAVRSAAQLRFYIAFLIGGFLLYPVRGALVNYVGGYSTFGRAIWNMAYGNPNDLAGFCLVFVSLTLSYIYIGRHRLWRMGAVGAAALMLLVILLTQSRGAFLALVATTVVGFILVKRRGRALGVMSILAVLSLPFVPDSAWGRFGGLSKVGSTSGMRGVDREGSAEQRYQVLQIAMRIASENPVFGVGPMMYAEVAPRYGAMMSSQYPLARNVIDPHNTYLRLSTELGIPGLLLFVGMVATVLRRSWKTSAALLKLGDINGQVFRMLILGLLAYLLAGLFGSIPYINVLYILTAVMGSLVARAELVMTQPLPGPQALPIASPGPSRPQLRMGVRGGLAVRS
jgi:O-antigen ligase